MSTVMQPDQVLVTFRTRAQFATVLFSILTPYFLLASNTHMYRCTYTHVYVRIRLFFICIFPNPTHQWGSSSGLKLLKASWSFILHPQLQTLNSSDSSFPCSFCHLDPLTLVVCMANLAWLLLVSVLMLNSKVIPWSQKGDGILNLNHLLNLSPESWVKEQAVKYQQFSQVNVTRLPLLEQTYPIIISYIHGASLP